MKRMKIPSMISKKVFQEAANCCPFCKEAEVEALQIHHIDEEPTNNDLANLILVCASCHAKITHGAISTADVHLQKRMTQFTARARDFHAAERTQSVNVSQSTNTGIIANVVNIKGRKDTKRPNPVDSIGADAIKKGYIHYLAGKYIDFRKADSSFGAFGHAARFHPGEIHTTIFSRFKAKTFDIHIARFDELAEYIQGRIDRTILGKRNISQGHPNYSSFDAYQREQLGNG